MVAIHYTGTGGLLRHEYSNDETDPILRIFEISGPPAVFNKKTGSGYVNFVPPRYASPV
jgi:hypothetical protein